MKTVEVLGINLQGVTASELLVELRKGLEAGRRQQVVTVTTEMVMHARRNPAQQKLINRADWRIADTIGLVWGAFFLAKRIRGPLRALRIYWQAFRTGVTAFVWPRTVHTVLPGTVPGSDLVVDLAGMCEEFGYGLYLLGGAPGVAEAVGQKLQVQFPRLQIAGTDSADPESRQDQEIRQRITASKTQVLLVAYGAPAQEQWIARNLPKLPKPLVAIGVGGTFDTIAGGRSLTGGGEAAKQPPARVRRHGLEWLWRLVTQPSRWRRIFAALPAFVWAVVREKLDKR